ncbi:hypothetical protein [Bradyrhizobium japonicum]|uniref:hypothetical protein n=1 Tax=Bradyrhizobium japonicum TaxID=375 RepID=UPI001B8A614F|nr:hypothetical protein [Bradyrhizobium japonicum]MBR0974652.1 hypothetical protein [Bradyrhizobium japonicum]
MQSLVNSETIQKHAQFRATFLFDCDDGMVSARPRMPAAPRKKAKRPVLRTLRPAAAAPGLLFFQTLAPKLAAAGRDWDE